MRVPGKLKHELKAVALTTLYFAVWLGVLVLLKRLVLADYQIEFRGLSVAIVGALIIAKVVLVLEHVPMGFWFQKQPAVFDVVLRTALYGVGVAAVLLLEKAFESRKEYGGFGRAVFGVFHHRDIRHVWANAVGLTWALMGFNALSILRGHFGDRELAAAFLSPALEESSGNPQNRLKGVGISNQG
jgi:hypothetical protein